MLGSVRAHEGDAKVSAFCRLAGLGGAGPPPLGAWQRWLELLACLRRLQGDQWPVLLQVHTHFCSCQMFDLNIFVDSWNSVS